MLLLFLRASRSKPWIWPDTPSIKEAVPGKLLLPKSPTEPPQSSSLGAPRKVSSDTLSLSLRAASVSDQPMRKRNMSSKRVTTADDRSGAAVPPTSLSGSNRRLNLAPSVTNSLNTSPIQQALCCSQFSATPFRLFFFPSLISAPPYLLPSLLQRSTFREKETSSC